MTNSVVVNDVRRKLKENGKKTRVCEENLWTIKSECVKDV